MAEMCADDCESVSSLGLTDCCSVTTSWSPPSRLSVATTCAASARSASTDCTTDGTNADWLAAQIDECLAAMDRVPTAQICEQRRSWKSNRHAPPALDLSAARMSECIERPLPSSPELLGAPTPSKPDQAVASGSSRRLTFQQHTDTASPSPLWGEETDYASPFLFGPLSVQPQCDAAPFPYSPCRESIHMLVADLGSSRSLFPHDGSVTTPEAESMSFTLTDYHAVATSKSDAAFDHDSPRLARKLSLPKERAKDTTSLAMMKRDVSSMFPSSEQAVTPPSSFLSYSSSSDSWIRALPTETQIVSHSSCDKGAGGESAVFPPSGAVLGSTRTRKSSSVSVPKRETSLVHTAVQVSPTSTQIVEESRKMNKLKKLLGEEVGPLVLDASPSRTHGANRRYGSVSAEARLQKPLPKVPVVSKSGRSQTTDGLDASLLNYLSLSPAKVAKKPFFACPKGKTKAPSLKSTCSTEDGCATCDRGTTKSTLQGQYSSSTDSLRQLASSFPRRRGGVSL